MFRDLRPHLKGVWNRIETKTVNGFPDVIGTGDGLTIAIENKIDYAEAPAVTAVQAKWHERWVAAGGLSCVLWVPKPYCFRVVSGLDVMYGWWNKDWLYSETDKPDGVYRLVKQRSQRSLLRERTVVEGTPEEAAAGTLLSLLREAGQHR